MSIRDTVQALSKAWLRLCTRSSLPIRGSEASVRGSVQVFFQRLSAVLDAANVVYITAVAYIRLVYQTILANVPRPLCHLAAERDTDFTAHALAKHHLQRTTHGD